MSGSLIRFFRERSWVQFLPITVGVPDLGCSNNPPPPPSGQVPSSSETSCLVFPTTLTSSPTPPLPLVIPQGQAVVVVRVRLARKGLQRQILLSHHLLPPKVGRTLPLPLHPPPPTPQAGRSAPHCPQAHLCKVVCRLHLLHPGHRVSWHPQQQQQQQHPLHQAGHLHPRASHHIPWAFHPALHPGHPKHHPRQAHPAQAQGPSQGQQALPASGWVKGHQALPASSQSQDPS